MSLLIKNCDSRFTGTAAPQGIFGTSAALSSRSLVRGGQHPSERGMLPFCHGFLSTAKSPAKSSDHLLPRNGVCVLDLDLRLPFPHDFIFPRRRTNLVTWS